MADSERHEPEDLKHPSEQEREESERRDEFGNPPDPKLRRIGSKKGFITSSERDHETGGDSYEHTGSDNREGMGSGTEAGPAHQGHSKPGRESRE